MRALTVQQPWAWAIFNGKNVENRTALWAYRGPLAIHAGLRASARGFGDRRILAIDRGNKAVHEIVYGAIIGLVDLVDVHPDAGCCRPWGESTYGTRRQITHLVLERPREFAEPILCKGALGLWTPPPELRIRLEVRDAELEPDARFNYTLHTRNGPGK